MNAASDRCEKDLNTPSWRKGYRGGRRALLADNAKTTRMRLEKMGMLNLSRSARILDFGCGDGNLIRFLEEQGFENVVGVEPDEELVRESALAGRVIAARGPGLPFEESTFDAIVSMAVLHHLPDEDTLQEVVKEFARLLRPGGLFCYAEPSNSWARSLLTPLLLSPLGLLCDFSRKKRLMVMAERDTLRRWLSIERRVPESVVAPAGFRIVSVERHAVKTYLRALRT